MFDDTAPVLSSPLRSSGARPGWITTTLVTVAVGGVHVRHHLARSRFPRGARHAAGVGGGLRKGLPRRRCGRSARGGGPDGHHRAEHLPLRRAEFGWPNHFETASTLAWFAVAALGADAVVQEVRARRAKRPSRPDESPLAGSRLARAQGPTRANICAPSNRIDHGTVSRIVVDAAHLPAPEAIDEPVSDDAAQHGVTPYPGARHRSRGHPAPTLPVLRRTPCHRRGPRGDGPHGLRIGVHRPLP